MIKLGIASIVLLLLFLMFREWRKGLKADKKIKNFKDKIEKADDRLDEIYVDHVVLNYDEEIRDQENSYKDRINKFNSEDIKKDD